MMNPAWFNPKPIAPLTDTAQETELTDGSPGQIVGGKMQMGKSFQAAKVDPSAQMWASLSKMAKDAQKITFESAALYEGIPQAKGEEVKRKALMRQDRTTVEPIFTTLAEDYATTEGEKTLEFTDPNTKEVTKKTYDMTNERSRVDYARARYEAAVEGLEVKSPEYQKRISEQSLRLYNADLKGDGAHAASLIEQRETMLLQAAAEGDPSQARAYLNDMEGDAWNKLQKEIESSIGNIPDQELATNLRQLVERQDISLEQSIAEGNREKFEVAVARMVNLEYGAMKDMLISINENSTADSGTKAREFIGFLTNEGLITSETVEGMDIESLFRNGTSAREQADMLKKILVSFAGFQSAQNDSNLSENLVETILQTTLTRGSAYAELARANRKKNLGEKEMRRLADLADLSAQLEVNPEDRSVILREANARAVFETDPKEGRLVSGGGADVLLSALAADSSVRSGQQDTIITDSIRSTTASMFNSRWSSGNVDMSQGQDTFMTTSKSAPLSSSFADIIRGKNKDYVTKLDDQSYVLTAKGQGYVWGQFAATEKFLRKSNQVQDRLRATFMAKVNSKDSFSSGEERYEETVKDIGAYVRAATGATTSDKDIIAAVGASGEFNEEDLPSELRSLTPETTRFIKSTIQNADRDRQTGTNFSSTNEVVRENNLPASVAENNEPLTQPQSLHSLSLVRPSETEQRWLDRSKVFFDEADKKLEQAKIVAQTGNGPLPPTVAELSERFVDLPSLRKQLKEYEKDGNKKAAAEIREEIRGKELVAQSYHAAYRARAEVINRYVIPLNETDKQRWGGQEITWKMIDESAPLEDFATTRVEEIFDPETGLLSVNYVASAMAYIIETAEAARGGASSSQFKHGSQENFAELQKVIGNLHSVVLNNMSGGLPNSTGNKALLGLAYIGSHLDRLNTQRTGETMTVPLDDGTSMEMPLFKEGAYLLTMLQAAEGTDAASTPFGMHALMQLGRRTFASQGQEEGLQDTAKSWAMLWESEFGSYIAGATVAYVDGNMPRGDITTQEMKDGRVPRPNDAMVDSRINQYSKNNPGLSSRDIGNALGIRRASETLSSSTPQSAMEIQRATMAAGGEGRGISPLTGKEVDAKQLVLDFQAVDKAIQAQRDHSKSLGKEVPTFVAGEEKPASMSEADWARIKSVDNKDIIEAMLVAGDLPFIQEKVGDQYSDWSGIFLWFGKETFEHDETGLAIGTDGRDVEGNPVFNMSHYPAALASVKSGFNIQFHGMEDDFHVGLNTANSSGLTRAIAGLRMWNSKNSTESMSLGESMEVLRKMRHYQNGPYNNINVRKMNVNDNGALVQRDINPEYRQHPPTTNSPVTFDGEVVMNQNEASAVTALLFTPPPAARERFVNEMFGPRYQNTKGWSTFVAAATKEGVSTREVLKLAQEHLKINNIQLDLDPIANKNVTFGMTSEEKRNRAEFTATPKIDYIDVDKDNNVALKWGDQTITHLPPYMFPRNEGRESARRLTEAFVHYERDWRENGWPMFSNPKRIILQNVGDTPLRAPFYNTTSFEDTPTEYDEARKSWYSFTLPNYPNITRVKRPFVYDDLKNVQDAMRAAERNN